MRKTALSVAALVAYAALVVGCSKNTSSQTTTTTTAASPAAVMNAVGKTGGDAMHGKQIFTQNCATCHGATGTEGGVGPSLRNEKTRKNMAAAIAWIKNPRAPMPKLYPSPLNEKDVTDVAAYVESL